MLIELGSIQFDDRVILQQLKNDLRDDWFPDPRQFEDIFKHLHVQKTISENFSKNHGTYRPVRRDVLNVPKPNFTLRYGLETSISDRAVYHALTSHLVPFYDPLMPWNVFSHRKASNPKSKTIFGRAIGAWHDFVEVVRNVLKVSPILLSTDLTNYFENINIEKLKKEMIDLLPEVDATPVEKGLIRTHIDVLFACLPEWCYTPVSGLPQNRDASSFLANVYMLAVDRAMLEQGYQYFRYMDDIKIACADEFEARRALKELSLQLRKLGLSINSGKTKICKSDDDKAIGECLDSGGDELRQIDAILSNSVQYFPLISVQLFPLFQLSEGDFYAV